MVHPTDTLIYDSAKIAGYQANKRFDYSSRLDIPEINLSEIISRWLSRFLSPVFDTEAADIVILWFLIIFFVVAMALIVFFIYKKRPGLFMKEKRKPICYEIEEESIYGVDFEKEIANALAQNDFRSAIRMLYLQTVRRLADKHYIDWQIYKSPTEYIYELKPVHLKVPFHQFTNHFLQVRYGNFKASGELFERMSDLQRQLKEGEMNEA